MGKRWKLWQILFSWAPNQCKYWLQPWNLKMFTPWKESYDQPRKGPSSQGYVFSSGHVRMWELDCEETWVLKNWCFWTVVLEKTLESPLDCNISLGCSLEGLMLKLKLQYFGHLLRRADWFEKILMLGKIEGRRRRGRQRMRPSLWQKVKRN